MMKLRIKQGISKRKLLGMIVFIFILLILILYFKSFYTQGMYFNDVFLKREETSLGSIYSNQRENVQISVENNRDDESIKVIYALPNDIHRQYQVSLQNGTNMETVPLKIEDVEGKLVFEGIYREDSPFLYDKGNDLFMNDSFQTRVNGEIDYNKDFEASLKSVADFAVGANTIRGKYELLAFAILLFVITAIDIKYPLFFFTLKHFLTVNDPEPSDLYLSIQRTCWYIYPFIGILLMFFSIN